MTFKDILSVSATITTIGQFLAGIFTVMKVWRMGSAGDLSPFPFLTGVVGCSLWLFYGIIINDPTVMYTNVVGLLMNTSYVGVFLLYSVKRIDLIRQFIFACAFLGAVVAYIGTIEEQLQQKNNLGFLCVVITLLCCASPLIALKLVVQTKSTETLPFPLILFMFLVCSQWWLYGVIIDDFYMQVTNFLGTIIALLQLSLFVIYPAGKKRSVPPAFYSPLKTQMS